MFGAFRTLLALLVVFGHLHGPFHLGVYAVFGFYMLSGFLMTKVMHETYGYARDGRLRFAFNRALRIYPSYWAVAGVTCLVLATGGGGLTDFHPRIHVPTDLEGWLRNVALVFGQQSSPRLSPATWALTVELFYYALIGLGLSRTGRRSLVWLAVSVVYTALLIALRPYDWEARYFPIPAASLPFAVGACLYHFRERVGAIVSGVREPAVWFALVLANFAACFLIDRILGGGFRLSLSLGFYLNLVLITGCLVALMAKGFLSTDARRDAALGRYSYPVYLTHWFAGGVVAQTLFASPARNHQSQGDLLYFGVSLAATLVLSWLLIRFVDDPIERLRGRVRAG